MCNQFPTEFAVCKLQHLVVRKGVKIDFLDNQRLKGIFLVFFYFRGDKGLDKNCQS